MTETTITQREMLQLLDVRYHPNGKPMIYSVKFVQLDGKLRFFPQAIVCGAGKMHNKAYRMRGFQPCDCKGFPEDHVYPVRINNILEFNGRRVIFTKNELKDADTVQ